MGKPPSPTGEGTAATRSFASAAATGRVERRSTSGRAMASSGPTTDRYSGTYRRGDRYSGGFAVGAATAPSWGGYYGPYAYDYGSAYGGSYGRRCYCR